MTGRKGMKGSGGSRPGAGRPTLRDEFAKQKEAVEQADAFETDEQFKIELRRMQRLQRRIEKRLAEAQAIVDDLEPLVGGSDWRQMSGWVKRYGGS